jgi:hypothetical protein
MANKKNEQQEFTVTDRRRFSEEGETRSDIPAADERESSAGPTLISGSSPAGKSAPEPTRQRSAGQPPAPAERDQRPPGPTAAERAESDRAYKASTDAMDDKIRRELGGQVAPDDFKVGFDRIVEPLYVTALVQLGFMGQENQNQRRVDIIGARQSIDALTLLQEKTKGNLTPTEASLLEDVLYDIRMKYLEITNALARAVQNPEGAPSGKA